MREPGRPSLQVCQR